MLIINSTRPFTFGPPSPAAQPHYPYPMFQTTGPPHQQYLPPLKGRPLDEQEERDAKKQNTTDIPLPKLMLHVSSPSPQQNHNTLAVPTRRKKSVSPMLSPVSVSSTPSADLLPEIPLTNSPDISTTKQRMFRQRRKDPSCDSCRERKVKCDATESSSCSECASRHLKCQFTKETNRRMSSIKQIRDLENSVQKLVKHISGYQDLLKERDIHVPEHLQSAEKELNLNSLVDPQSPGPLTPGPLSPIPLHMYPKSPVPSLLMPPLRDSLAPTSPSLLQQQQHLLKTPEFSFTNHSQRVSSVSLASPGPSRDYSIVLEFFKTYNRDAIRHPVSQRDPGIPALSSEVSGVSLINLSSVKNMLPMKEKALEIAQNYWTTFHHWMSPIRNWPLFIEKIEELFEKSNEELLVDPWSPVVFAVLALGNKDHSGSASDKFMSIVQALINPSLTQHTLPSTMWILTALLKSLYFAETNRMALASVEAGVAWNLAYEQGLTSPRTANQQRIWWNVFAWDRLLALRLGRRPFIAEPYRQKIVMGDEELASSGDPLMYASIMVHLIQIVDVTIQTLHSQTVLSKQALALLNSHFETFWSILPAAVLNGDVDTPLNGKDLGILILLKYLQYVLLRLNLSPEAPSAQFTNTLDSIYVGAKHLTRFYTRFRTHVDATVSKSRPDRTAAVDQAYYHELALHSFEIMSTHTWQALLILLSAQDFARALILLDALTAQASTRPSLNRYGLFILGFVRLLDSKWSANPAYRPMDDLDVVAIISTDLQSMDMHAWVWPSTRSGPETRSDVPVSATVLNSSPAGPTREESWSDWGGLKAVLLDLQRCRLSAVQQPAANPTSSAGAARPATLQDQAPSPAPILAPELTVTPAAPVNSTSSSSRMSLSHIM